ncbi:hypothetical protein GEU84_012015 [Fertoebacter nigrum]|uniref:Uncharacterized protein n=1 Tax=Fertoeibacter niger TaxID=2656921 RepID=A0A8X8GXX2_9RHOB|nr:hypothetical protein [Fertoeibacter niger]NUB45117.1 hypothetical protein [Fertoeibacter niger]
MQVFRHSDHEATVVGWDIRVLLLARDGGGASNPVARALAGLGGLVEGEAELYTALAAMIDDPLGYGLFVMECDGYGGAEAGQLAVSRLTAAGLRLPVLLISRDCREQRFPADRSAPVLLRAPLSAVSLRVGFEHALRDRLLARVWQQGHPRTTA